MATIEIKKVASANEAIAIISRLNYMNCTFEYEGTNHWSDDHNIECRHFETDKSFSVVEIVKNGKLTAVRFYNLYRDIIVELQFGDTELDYSNFDNIIIVGGADNIDAEQAQADNSADVKGENTMTTIETKNAGVTRANFSEASLNVKCERRYTFAFIDGTPDKKYVFWYGATVGNKWKRISKKTAAEILAKYGLSLEQFEAYEHNELEIVEASEEPIEQQKNADEPDVNDYAVTTDAQQIAIDAEQQLADNNADVKGENTMTTEETKKVASAEEAIAIINELNYTGATFTYVRSFFSEDRTDERRYFKATEQNGQPAQFALFEIVIDGRLQAVKFLHFGHKLVEITFGGNDTFTTETDGSEDDNDDNAFGLLPAIDELIDHNEPMTKADRDWEVRRKYLAQRAAERAIGNYTIDINGEEVTFKNHSIVKIIAPKLGYGYSTESGKGKFYTLQYGMIYRPAAKKHIYARYDAMELAEAQLADAKVFFNTYGDGENSDDFFSVTINIRLADGKNHSFIRYFNYLNQALDFANDMSEKFADKVTYFLAIDRNNINKHRRYFTRDYDGSLYYDIPATADYAGTHADVIQSQIDDLNRTINDNDTFAKQAEDNYVWSALMNANHELRKTRNFLEFVLHEDENKSASANVTAETDGSEDDSNYDNTFDLLPAINELNDVDETHELVNRQEADNAVRHDGISNEMYRQYKALDWKLKRSRGCDGKSYWFSYGRRISAKEAERILAKHGFTVDTYLGNLRAYRDEVWRIFEKTEFVEEKIWYDRRRLDDNNVFDLLPDISELNDVDVDAEQNQADIANDKPASHDEPSAEEKDLEADIKLAIEEITEYRDALEEAEADEDISQEHIDYLRDYIEQRLNDYHEYHARLDALKKQNKTQNTNRVSYKELMQRKRGTVAVDIRRCC